jgi:hypothetical protein
MAVCGQDLFYFGCAKTATQAITSALLEDIPEAQFLSETPNRSTQGRRVVAVSVREPYHRCLSLWWALSCQPGDYYGFAAFRSDPAGLLIELMRIRHIAQIRYPRVNGNGHLCWSCAEWCGITKPTRVIRQECLLDDYNELMTDLGLPLRSSIPVVNRKPNGRPPRDPLADPRFMAMVEVFCCDDFEQFGYKKRTA